MHVPAPEAPPRISVVVAAREIPSSAETALASIATQLNASEIEVIVADGSEDGSLIALAGGLLGARCIAIPKGNLPALKAEAIRQARGEWVAILDPCDIADRGWTGEILAAFDDPGVWAVGGSVLLDGAGNPGNVAAYLFEYGAFNPPLAGGDTRGDLPGNNVAYRRSLLVDTCADLLASEGFIKPLVHEAIRARGGRLAIRPEMRVRHRTSHTFLSFGVRRYHYARALGARRVRRASPSRRLFYRVFAPAVAPLLVVRQMTRALRHPGNRRLLPGSMLALCGICVFWGGGEWIGYWFGPGESSSKLY